MNHKFAIAIHGGAGTILRSNMTEAMQMAYEKGLEAALHAGIAVLKNGGRSIDAVEEAIKVLEDCELFNAGRGSVFNHIGKHEMDAAIMEGAQKRAGAVAGVGHVKNPISLARAVMEKSEHVMLAARGAEDFGRAHGEVFCEDAYFFTEQRYEQWQEALKNNNITLDHSDKKFGTVGAVALDVYGNLAAGTSTGGMTNKQYGRIGDSPIIGAGTYADNHTCAISCTGHGELFMRAVVGHDIACLMEYKGCTLHEACDILVHDKLIKIGGEGGLIGIDKHGHIAMPFNSEGMYRGCADSSGMLMISIYKD